MGAESAQGEAQPEGLRVRLLGSGDAFGSGGRLQTCIALEAARTRVLLDCGATSLTAMRRFGVEPPLVDAIAVTHLHGDHFGGLPFFILDAQFGRRERPLTIAGPPGLAERLRDTMEALFPGSSRTQQRFALDLIELRPGTRTAIGSAAMTAFPVQHASGAPAFALRIECAGRVIAYSGDTEWADSLIAVADGADLFICEAYFFDKQVKYHLDYRTLLTHRDALRCRRLVLTHMSADMLRHVAEVPEECGEDGLVIEV